MRITKFRAPIYCTQIWVVVSKSLSYAFDKVEDQIDMRIIAEQDKRSVAAYTFAFEDHNGRTKVILFLKPNALAGDIAHECKHAVNVIFSWHGVKLSLANDEHECYMLGWMVDRCHNAIKRFKK